MELTVSGPIGSGKSTVAKILASRLGVEYMSTGDIFRDNARKHRMSVEAFNEYAEKHPEVDIDQDNYLIERMKNSDGLVIDSRLAGWLSYKNRITAFRIYITADNKTRVERISGREKVTPDQATVLISRREESEAKRYRDLYDVDIRDTSIYDMILDTTNMTPEDAVNAIIEKMKELNA
jgi:cytidylate kinase